jgi:hypothetical protein
MNSGSDVEGTLGVEYRTLAVDWDAARDTHDEADSVFKAHHAVYKKLRRTSAGRLIIAGFLDDPVTAVRLLAATHSLRSDPIHAVAALEEIEQGSSPYALDAKWTLRSYRNGKLNLDW